MREHNPHRAWAMRIAFASSLMLLTACTTTIRQHPDFHERVAQVVEVGIMPPEVIVTKIMFKGDNQRLTAEERGLARQIPQLLLRSLAEHDFTVRVVPLDDEMFKAFPELRFETTQSQLAFASAMNQMYKTVDILESNSLTSESLGPEVTQFADVAGVDTLLFSRYSAFKKSEGELAKDIIVGLIVGGIPPTEGGALEVSLVDGITGDVLWSNHVQRTDQEIGFANLGKGFSILEILVRDAFEKFER